MTLYLPIAVPGSGKSTLARTLVEEGDITADAVVSPDDYRELLTGDCGNQEVNANVFSIVDKIVFTRMSYGLDVFLDATNLTPSSRLKPAALAGEFNHDVIVFLWDQPKWIAEKRNKEREHAVPSRVMNKMFARLEQVDLETEFEGIEYEVCTVYP